MKKTYTEFSTLGDLLVKAAQQYDGSDMLIFPERRVTYTQMHDMAYRRARALVASRASARFPRRHPDGQLHRVRGIPHGRTADRRDGRTNQRPVQSIRIGLCS